MEISTVKKGTKAYKNLEAVAKMLEAVSEKGAVYRVKDVYFDIGQDWMWTTISREGGEWGGVQILSPRQWGMIIFAESVAELAEAVEDIRADKYFNE